MVIFGVCGGLTECCVDPVPAFAEFQVRLSPLLFDLVEVLQGRV
jgi:hypothetical protein